MRNSARRDRQEVTHGSALRIMYSTRIRIGAPTGPGVNEASFVAELRRLEERDGWAVVIVNTPFPSANARLPRPLAKQITSVRALLGEVRHFVRLVRTMRRERPSLHVSRVGPIPVATYLSIRVTRVPFAAKTYSTAPRSAFGSVPIASPVAAYLDRALQRGIVRRSVAIDSVTPQIEALVRRMEPRARVCVVDNGVDTEAFLPVAQPGLRAELEIPSDAPVVVYVGGQPTFRGGREVIDVVAQCGDLLTHGLVVGCTGSDLQELERYAKQLGVEGRVRLLSHRPPDEVPAVMGVGNLGIALDDMGRATYYGNASQKIRQYLSCGLAVIAYEGTNSFVVAHRVGALVQSADQVPAAARALLTSRELLTGQLAARARSVAESSLSQSERTRQRVAIWKGALGVTD